MENSIYLLFEKVYDRAIDAFIKASIYSLAAIVFLPLLALSFLFGKDLE